MTGELSEKIIILDKFTYRTPLLTEGRQGVGEESLGLDGGGELDRGAALAQDVPAWREGGNGGIGVKRFQEGGNGGIRSGPAEEEQVGGEGLPMGFVRGGRGEQGGNPIFPTGNQIPGGEADGWQMSEKMKEAAKAMAGAVNVMSLIDGGTELGGIGMGRMERGGRGRGGRERGGIGNGGMGREGMGREGMGRGGMERGGRENGGMKMRGMERGGGEESLGLGGRAELGRGAALAQDVPAWREGGNGGNGGMERRGMERGKGMEIGAGVLSNWGDYGGRGGRENGGRENGGREKGGIKIGAGFLSNLGDYGYGEINEGNYQYHYYY